MAIKKQNFQEKLDVSQNEHEVLEYWEKTQAFERSVSERPENKRYVFYDGPPFATGLPHYGHLLASTVKDLVPRYWTMKGYRVDRVWGWDCHGIPIENIIEKELELKGGKKGIEAYGIDKFNQACRNAILRFDKEWEGVIRRLGRWVDFKHSYKTMDKTFMESVWWAFATLHQKGLVYEGRKVILYCPRCATPLSNFEIAMDNSYKDVEDNSVFVKFKKVGTANEYFVAWTTTPWTLIGNVALAVDEKAEYVQVAVEDALLWVSKSLKVKVLGEAGKVVKTVKGTELVGAEYEPLYTYMPLEGKKAHYVTAADFVSLEDGSGIVHTAAIFGEDDYRLAVEKDLPRVPTLDDQGKFLDFVTPLAGVFYKKAESWVIEDLTARGLMHAAGKIVHSYPFCYRCETPLYFNAVPAWFIDVQKIKPNLIAQNEHINWHPDYLKHGRFGKGLEGAPDWNISRSRYWGTPMPIWKAGNRIRIVGSVEELKKWAVDPKKVEALTDIHREFLDDLEVWVDDECTIKGKRIPEVFDCWIESGSMPFASLHFPFEQKEIFGQSHPAQFIAEYIAQTRAWFYTLHVMSVGLFGKHTFENAVTTGTILAEDGNKMSKSKKNFPDPALVMEKYGVDALRFYLMASVVMKAENLNFSETGVKEVYQKVVSIVWNVFSFYKLYVKDPPPSSEPKAVHVLDRWVLSRLNTFVNDATAAMDAYDTTTYCRHILAFLSELSTWYLRRSRDRIQTDRSSQEVFGWVINVLVRIMAPVTPFITETIYQNLVSDTDSVHLSPWPQANSKLIDKTLEHLMNQARLIVAGIHALRKENNIPVRQPLAYWSFDAKDQNMFVHYPGIFQTIEEETNVKKYLVDEAAEKLLKKSTTRFTNVTEGDLTVYVDTEITPELEREGLIRKLIRDVQVARKEKGCKIDQRVQLSLPTEYKNLPSELLEQIKRETLADTIVWADQLSVSTTK